MRGWERRTKPSSCRFAVTMRDACSRLSRLCRCCSLKCRALHALFFEPRWRCKNVATAEGGRPTLMVGVSLNSGGFLSPPLRRGRCAVQEKWNATLETAQRGEVKHVLHKVFDLPRRAE